MHHKMTGLSYTLNVDDDSSNHVRHTYLKCLFRRNWETNFLASRQPCSQMPKEALLSYKAPRAHWEDNVFEILAFALQCSSRLPLPINTPNMGKMSHSRSQNWGRSCELRSEFGTAMTDQGRGQAASERTKEVQYPHANAEHASKWQNYIDST